MLHEVSGWTTGGGEGMEGGDPAMEAYQQRLAEWERQYGSEFRQFYGRDPPGLQQQQQQRPKALPQPRERAVPSRKEPQPGAAARPAPAMRQGEGPRDPRFRGSPGDPRKAVPSAAGGPPSSTASIRIIQRRTPLPPYR